MAGELMNTSSKKNMDDIVDIDPLSPINTRTHLDDILPANSRKSYLPLVPKTVTTNIGRVYWIDTMRIIACLAVPIVHAINYTGTPGRPDPKFPEYNFCDYDRTNATQTIPFGRRYSVAQHSEAAIQIEEYMMRRMMSGFMFFFFASGAALFLSFRRVEHVIESSYWRFLYIMGLLVFGVVSCVIPSNMIRYSVGPATAFQLNPIQHLGFLVTLVVFTYLSAPIAWAVISRSGRAWLTSILLMIGITATAVVLPMVDQDISKDIATMVVIMMVNFVWMIVSSYYESLREARAFTTTALSLLSMTVPDKMTDVWGERAGGVSNAIITGLLVGILYLVPFVLGFFTIAFPTKNTPERRWVKTLLALFMLILIMFWTDPINSDGWLEANSIRTYDDRLNRFMYTANNWVGLWVTYTLAKAINDTPFPQFFAAMSKYVLILYIFHPLFLSYVSCNVIVYSDNWPRLLETVVLYTSAIIGCGNIYAIIFLVTPRVVKRFGGRVKEENDNQMSSLRTEISYQKLHVVDNDSDDSLYGTTAAPERILGEHAN
ncbi:hypothetical protein SARC_10632 [Sphaeroforma arctica JP610]|uniref:Acyltransferase 3 domain-containing protein n=1 Tax=Sphaeroforma arctica JP610 TaxID=667725 RepID=A0A0L0FJC0_9EUKA|nr:hypothetical protein SARC_10632 [Sphaeroforma arctica JP610]KNC76889.1 hypothetical protein SARC_10632 [Sphaeroforma arctica JP610]|eukprot:XP_014150791.1 hypothetical protein SARC_10632 [Sphaeroforma arctica JP610]